MMNSAPAGDVAIALDPRLDTGLVGRVFRSAGRVHIGGILTAAAADRIHRALADETPWSYVVGDESGNRDLPVASLDELSPDERAAIVASTDSAAVRGFAYRYSSFRIDGAFEAGRHREHYLMRVLAFLNSKPFLDFARHVTGVPQIAFADAQATLYRPGDFLTTHDDEVEGKNRHAAYVLNFTPEWRVDWGGLLAFPDPYGHVTEAFGPAFNALNLMRVPTPHTVTQVASFAGAGRYSITGWLRSRS
jgi:SM-20-related protein